MSSNEASTSTDRKMHIRIQPSKSASLHLSFLTKLSNLKAQKFPQLQWEAEFLISLWQQFSNIVRNSTEECVREYVETLCEKTKEFTMHEDWTKVVPTIRNHLVVLRNNLNVILISSHFSDTFKNFITGMIGFAVEPWKHPLILNLMKTDCNLDDVASYFDFEQCRKITIDRLRLLLSRVKRPNDYIYVTNFVGNILIACERFKKMKYTWATDERDYIRDVYLVGLFNLSKTKHLLEHIRQMPFEDCYHLHKRYMENGIGFSNSDNERTFWQHTEHVINAVNHNLLLRLLGLDLTVWENFDLLGNVLSICIEREDLTCEAYQHSILCALTCYGKSSNVRKFNELFIEKLKNQEDLKSFCTTLFIKELNTTINELEHYKTTLNKELADISRRHLSDSYLFVGKYFHNDAEICKEAVLNAFNTNPTEINYRRVAIMASLKTDEEPSRNSNGKPIGNSNGKPSENSNGYPIGNSNAEPFGYFNGEAGENFSVHSKEDLNENPSGDLNGEPSGDSNERPIGYPNGYPIGNSNGEPFGYVNGEAGENFSVEPKEDLNENPSGDLNGERNENLCRKCNGVSNGKVNVDLNGNPSGDSCGKHSRDSHGEPRGDSNVEPGQDSNGRHSGYLNKDTYSYDSLLRDLSLALKYNRHYSLSWSLDWNMLARNCIAYMKNFDANNAEKELIYLNLDFDKLEQKVVNSKDWYVDIEEGYEQYFNPAKYKK